MLRRIPAISLFLALLLLEALPLYALQSASSEPAPALGAEKPPPDSRVSVGSLTLPEIKRIGRLLPGTYRKEGPNGSLTISLTHLPFDRFFLQAAGERGGEKFLERGYLQLSGDSRRIELTYAPGEFVDRFGCSFFITPTAEGFVGDTKGANCSFALRRPMHPWKIEAGASEIVVTDMESGEIHRLARVAEP